MDRGATKAVPARGRSGERHKALMGLLFASPVILGLIVWVIGPMIGVFAISLTDWNVLTTPKWIGFENYVKLVTSDLYFWNSLLVTIYFVALNVVLSIGFSLIVAIMLNQTIVGRSFFRTLFYLPSIIPIVASSALWLWLFNPDFGLINMGLQGLGLPRSKWLSSQTTVVPSIVLMNVWGTAGNIIVIFLAALQGVPRQLLEAVQIDGGNWWHRFRAVTVPMISPVIFFNVVTGVINGFSIFTQAYVMTNGGPNNASLFYVVLLYREGFQRNNLGGAAALAVILVIIVSIIGMLLFKTSRNWVYYEGENQ